MRIRTTAKWMLTAFAVAAVMAIAIRLGLPPRERMVTALRATARWSFLLFWLATVGNPLRVLFGPRFKPLASHARDLGLSFASAHLVHLGLVGWMYLVSVPEVDRPTVIILCIGVFWIYLLALLSFTKVSQVVGAQTARALRLVGIEYISVVFFIDFNKDPFDGGLWRAAYYAPFLLLTVSGPLLRLAAAAKRLTQHPTLAPS